MKSPLELIFDYITLARIISRDDMGVYGMPENDEYYEEGIHRVLSSLIVNYTRITIAKP